MRNCDRGETLRQSLEDDVVTLSVILGGGGQPKPASRVGRISPSAVGHLKFVQDVGDRVAHGLLADGELLGNLRVGQVPGHQRQDFTLTLGQLREGLRWSGVLLIV